MTYEAPVREHPPGYRTTFCRHCGSPAPDLSGTKVESDWFELAAGLLDGDPEVHPDRHIFIECGSTWYPIADDLPRTTKEELIAMRKAEWKEKRGRWSRS